MGRSSPGCAGRANVARQHPEGNRLSWETNRPVRAQRDEGAPWVPKGPRSSPCPRSVAGISSGTAPPPVRRRPSPRRLPRPRTPMGRHRCCRHPGRSRRDRASRRDGHPRLRTRTAGGDAAVHRDPAHGAGRGTSVVTDYKGFTALAFHVGTATGSDGSSTTSRLTSGPRRAAASPTHGRRGRSRGRRSGSASTAGETPTAASRSWAPNATASSCRSTRSGTHQA
jgi:hypothetical protein